MSDQKQPRMFGGHVPPEGYGQFVVERHPKGRHVSIDLPFIVWAMLELTPNTHGKWDCQHRLMGYRIYDGSLREMGIQDGNNRAVCHCYGHFIE